MRGDPCIDCNRLSAAIARRAHELAKQRLAQLDHATNGNGLLPADQPPVQSPSAAPVAAATPVLTLPEAPASVNCHIVMEGRQVQVTLRDTDETRLLARLIALLQQYPVAQPPTQPPAQGTGQPMPDESPYCHVHKGALQQFTKDGRTWYSHKTADGQWCKGQ